MQGAGVGAGLTMEEQEEELWIALPDKAGDGERDS